MRRLLQIAVSVGALVPIAAGLMGIVLGPDMLGDNGQWTISMDSHYRYLSGLLLGIGLCFWSTVPDIEMKTARFQLLTMIVVTGGLARLYALSMVGVPNGEMLFGLGMELVVTPLLALWQKAVAQRT